MSNINKRSKRSTAEILILAFLTLFIIMGTTSYVQKQSTTNNVITGTNIIIPERCKDKSFIDVVRFSGNVTSEWANTLEMALKDSNCIMVVALINSGGGAVSTSMNVAHAFENLQTQYKKPVIVYSEYGMFSGAYLISLSSKLIGVSPGAETGSIGVIMIHVDATTYFDSAGVKITLIRSGKNKGIGSEYNKLTDDQLKVLQEEVTYYYNLFIDKILRSRKTTFLSIFSDSTIVRDSLISICDGRIYPAAIAVDYGLIDLSCYFDQFIQIACILHDIDLFTPIRKDDQYINVYGIIYDIDEKD